MSNKTLLQLFKSGGANASDVDPLKGILTATEGTASDVSREDHQHPDLSRDPDYDSGWFALAQNANIAKTHGLGTDKCLVELQGKTSGNDIHKFYGGWAQGGVGAWWTTLTTTAITIYRGIGDTQFINLRVFVWALI